MSTFFSGRVLNRFSKDVGFLDDVLAFHFLEFVMVMLPCSFNYHFLWENLQLEDDFADFTFCLG